MRRWFWLSFAEEGDGPFLGVVVVMVDDHWVNIVQRRDPTVAFMIKSGREESVPFYAAVMLAHSLGLNPGGEVAGWEITSTIDRVPTHLRRRLLSEQELADADLI